ncbi:MAG: J domain-containing protein [Butyrivibrio sp.]|nr:J domain-containing protein [Butyrivibrio sp.]
MDHYRILGLAETADAEAVKKAYRRLAKECHPDTHPGDKRAEERFKQITEAYGVLSDPEKRKKYDRERAGADFFSYMGERPGQSRKPRKQETGNRKQETKRNPIDTSGLFERYMGFK